MAKAIRKRGRRRGSSASPSSASPSSAVSGTEARHALEQALTGAVCLDDSALAAWTRLARSGPSRGAARELVAEGLRVVETALAQGVYAPAALVVAPDLVRAHEPASIARVAVLVARARTAGAAVHVTDRDAFRRLAGVAKPRGILAILRIPDELDAGAMCARLAAERGIGMAIVGLADSGNVGTLIRTGVAFGARVCFAVDGAADPFHPKVMRAAAGHLLPVAHAGWPELVEACRRHGVALAALVTAGGGEALDQALIPPPPLVVCIGNEGHGLGERARDATHRWTIPMAGAESLNAAVAGAIALWAASRRAARALTATGC